MLSLLALFGVDYVPTNDGPQHVFSLHARARLASGAHGWQTWFVPTWPVTNLGFALVFAPFDVWLPWRTALLFSQALMVLLWISGAFALARAIHPARIWSGILLGAAALQWSFYRRPSIRTCS